MRKLDRELARRDRSEKLKPLGVVVTTLAILFAIGGGIYLLTTAGGTRTTPRPIPQPRAPRWSPSR